MPDTSPTGTDALDALCGVVAENAASDLPQATLRKSALILADCIGAMAGGAAEPDVRALIDTQDAPGPALVIGTSQTQTPGTAALLNGTSGTTLEMDEGNQFAKGHPGMHTVPAALAVAPTDLPGPDLLTAIALGYEAGARVGTATSLRPSMHPHGTWGTLCAAVATARLRGADRGAMRHAMSMASSLSLATSRRTMLEGGTVRNVFTGISGQMGVLAGDLLASGYGGDRHGVTEVFGRVVSNTWRDGALTEDLGDRWEVDRNYFKMHACCRYNHAALDAVSELTGSDAIRPEDIDHITVETYNLAVELNDPAPANVLAAKFSLPFAVATALVTRQTGVASFTADRIKDPATLDLARRVTLLEDEDMSSRLPDQRPARVTLTLKSGRTLSARTDTNRGDWSDPYGDAEIYAKFLSLATRVWPPSAAEEIWDLCLALPHAPSAAPLFRALSRAVRERTTYA